MDIASYRWMVVVALLLGAAPQAFSQGSGGPGRASVPAFTSPRTVPIDSGTLSALPRETVAASTHGKTVQCEGVSMTALLRAANVLTAEALSSTQLANYVLVTARDGSRALYSLAELESTLGNNRVLLLDRCDGRPLTDEVGPLWLIAPDDSRPARWVRHVQSITVVAAP